MEGIQFFQMKGLYRLFKKEGDYKLVKIHVQNLEVHFKNHLTDFNQTWHKAFLGELTKF